MLETAMRFCFDLCQQTILIYVAGINSIYFLLLAVGYYSLRESRVRSNQFNPEALLRSPLVPGVSVLTPAYNEEKTILDSVRSMLRLRHPQHEVIVINDGSTDQTLRRLIEEFHLYRSSRVPTGSLPTVAVRGVYESRDPIRLVVIDKANSGKADSLNAGLNYARMPLFAAVDSDSVLERDALLGIIRPFLEQPESTIAAGGIIRVANGCSIEHGQIVKVSLPRTLIARLQVIEYLRAFLGGRVAFSHLNSLLVISGAFGLFCIKTVRDAGGFAIDTVGEDMEIVVRLHRKGIENNKRQRIVFVPEPVCWTEVPETLQNLRRQRNRWQRGALETIFRHWPLLFGKKSGNLGWFVMPYFILFELAAPVVELFGYFVTVAGLLTGFTKVAVAVEFFVVSIVFGILLSLSAIVLEELTARKYHSIRELACLFTAGVLEGFGFRQLTAIWRVQGTVDFFRRKTSWDRFDRHGFEHAPVSKAA